jgi:hypothetical protein
VAAGALAQSGGVLEFGLFARRAVGAQHGARAAEAVAQPLFSGQAGAPVGG